MKCSQVDQISVVRDFVIDSQQPWYIAPGLCLRSTNRRRRRIPLCDRPPRRLARHRNRSTRFWRLTVWLLLRLIHEARARRSDIPGEFTIGAAGIFQKAGVYFPASMAHCMSAVRPTGTLIAGSAANRPPTCISHRRRHYAPSAMSLVSLSPAAGGLSDQARRDRHPRAGDSKELRSGFLQINCSI